MKLYIFGSSFLLMILAEGAGAWFKHMFGVQRKGFHAPLGFALMLAGAQLLYYPAQMFNYSLRWIFASTAIILLAMLVFFIFDLADIKKSLLRKETLIVILCGLLFAILCSMGSVLGSEAGNEISMRLVHDVQAPKFQGYFHFALSYAWLINLPLKLMHLPAVSTSMAELYGLGLLYVLISSMLIVDVLRTMKLRNHWLEFALGAYLLLNGNYNAWSVNTAWLGLSWSAFFVCLAVFTWFTYLKENNEMIKYFLIPILAAGLASDNSFGLCGIAMLYGFMMHQFSIRKIRSLFDLTTFLIPHILYTAALFGDRWWPQLSWILVLLYAVFIFRRYHRPLRRWISRAEEYCFEHYREIFLIAVPVILIAASLIIGYLNSWKGLMSYGYYFSDFTEIDGMRDYTFIHSDILQILLNLFRWGGLICLVWLAKEPADQAVRMLLISVLLIFVNPLCTPAISYMTGPMFIHAFNVLFNPFTECIMFLYIYRMFQWTVIGQWVLEITLCLGAAGALIGMAGIL